MQQMQDGSASAAAEFQAIRFIINISLSRNTDYLLPG
jgi:hypothetical protein